MKKFYFFILFKFIFLLLCSSQVLAKKSERYALRDIPSVVERINTESSEEEQMRSVSTYEEFRENKDPKLPSWSTLYRRYRAEYGDGKGLSDFVFPNKPPVRESQSAFYSLEEVPAVIARINGESSEEEQINSISTYKDFYSKDEDPKLPSWSTITNWYRAEHGDAKGLSDFVFPNKPPVRGSQSAFYSLEEIPSVVSRINAESSEDEKMNSVSTYTDFRFKDPRLPSWSTVANWYREKHGDTKGLSDFIFPVREFKRKPERKRSSRFYALKEIPLVVLKINGESSKEEQIKSRVTYEEFRSKDAKLPAWMTLAGWYKEKYGNIQGLSYFMFPWKEVRRSPRRDLRRPTRRIQRQLRLYPLEEVPSVVVRINARSLEEEQMKSRSTYEVFRYKDAKLPAWMTLVNWYREEHGGDGKGLSDFVFGRSCERVMSNV